MYKVLMGKPEGKRLLERPRRRQDVIRMNLREIGSGVDWIRLAQDRNRWRSVVNAVMNPQFPALRN
jgi:monomeric isocitrate dehydrogenase